MECRCAAKLLSYYTVNADDVSMSRIDNINLILAEIILCLCSSIFSLNNDHLI